eukprot:1598901-Pyramimonas_sp.AAC.1
MGVKRCITPTSTALAFEASHHHFSQFFRSSVAFESLVVSPSTQSAIARSPSGSLAFPTTPLLRSARPSPEGCDGDPRYDRNLHACDPLRAILMWALPGQAHSVTGGAPTETLVLNSSR